MEASSTPTTTRLWASWATVEANAPARRPNPRTSPRPTRPVAWWRSTTAIFARSRSGSATTWPSATVGSSSRASVMSWPGTVSITRTRALAGIVNAWSSSGRGAHRRADELRDRRRRERHCVAVLRHQPTVLPHARRPELRQVLEQHEVGPQAGRDGAPVEQAVRPRRVQRRHQQRVLGRHALGHRDPAHLVDVTLAIQEVGLAVVGAERAVLGPVVAHQRQQVAQVARVRRLADQHPHAAAALLQRLLVRRRLVVGADPGGDVRVQRVAGDAGRVAVDVRRRRSARAPPGRRR